MSVIFVTLIAFHLFACKSVHKSVDVNKIYFGNIDENPMFNGKPAEDGFREYLAKNTIYPVGAMENGITGCVFVGFFIEEGGTISNVRIVGSGHPVLETEALRVVISSPNWSPGRVNGNPVKMSYIIPFNFKLNNVNTLSSLNKAELPVEALLFKEVVIMGFGGTKKENIVSRN
jgi:TonB family protein